MFSSFNYQPLLFCPSVLSLSDFICTCCFSCRLYVSDFLFVFSSHNTLRSTVCVCIHSYNQLPFESIHLAIPQHFRYNVFKIELTILSLPFLLWIPIVFYSITCQHGIKITPNFQNLLQWRNNFLKLNLIYLCKL